MGCRGKPSLIASRQLERRAVAAGIFRCHFTRLRDPTTGEEPFLPMSEVFQNRLALNSKERTMPVITGWALLGSLGNWKEQEGLAMTCLLSTSNQ